MLWLISLLACSSEYMEITGTISDSKFTPITAYFGGNYITFFNVDIDCKELHWVTNIYRSGDSPYDKDLEALQITFNDSDIIPGTYSTGGEAPIRAAYLNIAGDAFEVLNATDGQIISSVVEEDFTEGSFNFSFGDKIISGDYYIPFCTNLIH